jgi:hypothetical protein
MSKGILRSASRLSKCEADYEVFLTIFYCSFLADGIQSIDSHFVHDGFFSIVPQCKYRRIILDNFLLVCLFVCVMCLCVRSIYMFESTIFRTDAVKVIKLTVRSIGRHHLLSSSLPHADTGPTVFSIFETLPGSPFLSKCEALPAIRPGSTQR